MTEPREAIQGQEHPDLLGGLPRSRPHRRSAKRPARVETDTDAVERPRGGTSAERPRARPAVERPRSPSAGPARGRSGTAPTLETAPAKRPGPVATAVQAAAEIAEIGLLAGARTIRRSLSRLPRP